MAKNKAYGEFSKSDNTAFTLAEFLNVVGQMKVDHPAEFAKVAGKPLKMSSDEEGNSFGKLWAVGIAADGVTLWPADAR